MRSLNVFLVLLVLMCASCSKDDGDDYDDHHNPYGYEGPHISYKSIMDKIHVGMRVYDPVFGDGEIVAIYPDAKAFPYFTVKFDWPIHTPSNTMLYKWNGEYWDGEFLHRLQPSKDRYHW